MTGTDPDAARQLVESSSNIVVLTGAGVSTASGIPDFRGPEGVWTKNPAAERLSNIRSRLVSSSEVRIEAWQRLLRRREIEIRPNRAHRALVDFESTGKLKALMTQNTDGLHAAAGSDPSLLIEVHGNSLSTRCLQCGDETPTSEIVERVAAGELDPHCHAIVDNEGCGGVLKLRSSVSDSACPMPRLPWQNMVPKPASCSSASDQPCRCDL